MRMIIQKNKLYRCIIEPDDTEIIIPEGVKEIWSEAFIVYRHNTPLPADQDVWHVPHYDARNEFPDGELPPHLRDRRLHVVVPEGVTRILPQAFYNLVVPYTLELPHSLRKIEEFAFAHSSLLEIRIPAELDHLQQGVFMNCRLLTEIQLPDGCAMLPTAMAMGCTRLAHINLPDSLTLILDYALHNCASLTSLVLPAGLDILAGDAMLGCCGLRCFENHSKFRNLCSGPQASLRFWSDTGESNLADGFLPGEDLDALPLCAVRSLLACYQAHREQYPPEEHAAYETILLRRAVRNHLSHEDRAGAAAHLHNAPRLSFAGLELMLTELHGDASLIASLLAGQCQRAEDAVDGLANL